MMIGDQPFIYPRASNRIATFLLPHGEVHEIGFFLLHHCLQSRGHKRRD